MVSFSIAIRASQQRGMGKTMRLEELPRDPLTNRVIRQIKDLEQAFQTLGSALERPFLTLQTFCFTGLPFIRLTDKGLADVREKKLVDLFLEK